MIINIPPSETKQWQGIFPGNSSGTLWQTWNMDLERVAGRICLSGRGRILQASGTPSFSPPQKFLKTNADGTNRYWALHASGLLHSTDSTANSAWAADTISGAPTSVVNDFIVFGDSDHSDTDESDRLVVFMNRDTGGDIAILNKVSDTNIALHAWDTNWWTGTAISGGLAQTKLNGLVNHPCAKLQSLLGFCDGNKFHTIDKNDVPTYNRISFPIGMIGNLVYSSTNRFWIGLKPTVGFDGMIVEWDGFTENYNKDYFFPGTPITGWIKDNIPYFVNNYGQILKYNGESFSEVNRFPLFEQGLQFSVTHTSNVAGESIILPYGCVVDGNLVKMLVSVPNTSIRMRTGLWIYDTEKNNLYHSQSLGGYVTDSDGQPDYGHGLLFFAGGLFKTRGDYGDKSATATDLIAGGTYFTNYSDAYGTAIFKFGFNYGTDHQTNRGYFITPYISGGQISNFWSSLWVIFKKFIHADNRIVVKSMTEEPFVDANGDTIKCTITWITKTTFKGVIPTGVKIGDEVEVIAGRNSGCCFHISALSATPDGSATVTATLDESVPYGSDSSPDTSAALALFEHWCKAETLSDTSIGEYQFSLPGADSDGNPLNNGESVRFKVELRGKGMEVDRLIAVTKEAVTPE